MRTLTIGFSRSRHNKIGSLILQKYMDREYSHCFVIFRTADKLGDDSIYHSAMQSGIGFITMTNFLLDNTITNTYDLEIPDGVYFEVRKSLFSECGRKYGFWQNIGIGIVGYLSNYGIHLKNPFTDNSNCSELLYRHVFQVAFNDKNYDPDLVTPVDIEILTRKILTLRG